MTLLLSYLTSDFILYSYLQTYGQDKDDLLLKFLWPKSQTERELTSITGAYSSIDKSETSSSTGPQHSSYLGDTGGKGGKTLGIYWGFIASFFVIYSHLTQGFYCKQIWKKPGHVIRASVWKKSWGFFHKLIKHVFTG